MKLFLGDWRGETFFNHDFDGNHGAFYVPLRSLEKPVQKLGITHIDGTYHPTISLFQDCIGEESKDLVGRVSPYIGSKPFVLPLRRFQ